MNTRNFDIIKYDKTFNTKGINEDNFKAGLTIIKTILADIDIILQDYNIPEDKTKELREKRDIIANIYNKYNNLFSITRILTEYNALAHKQPLTDIEEKKLNILLKIARKAMIYRSYNNDICVLIPQYKLEEQLEEKCDIQQIEKVYKEIYKDYQICFELESQIHQDIVIPIWKEYLTKYNPQYEQGEHFAYLFHSGGGFVVLPGTKQYQSKEPDNNYKTDFISASLITEKEMESGNTNVGILVGIKDKTILTSFGSDCGTRDSSEKSVTNIKNNEKTGNSVSIGLARMDLPVSKLGTPKNIERQAMKASISNTGEILNAGKWIAPIYTEVVVDKEDFELEAILFKTTGCDINFKDFLVAKQMEMYYGKPLQIINQSICREKANLSPYTKQEEERFEKQLEFFSDSNNYKIFDQNPILFKNLIKLYYQEVIEKAGFKGEAKIKAQVICLKIAEYLNSVIEEKGLDDSNQIKLDDILNVNLEENDLPPVKYIPEIVWGRSTEVKRKDIESFILDIPQDLESKVKELLYSEVKIEKIG